MEKEILAFIGENRLNPFNKDKARIKSNNTIFKTADARNIANKTLDLISKDFMFRDTENILSFFSFTENAEEIIRRQNFFSSIKRNNDYRDKIKIPKAVWKPKYEVVVATEDESTFVKLKELSCPVKFLTNEDDILDLKEADIVQVIDCENFSQILENLPQSVFINDIDEIYLERYMEEYSGWIDNIEVLKQSENKEIIDLVNELASLAEIINKKESEKISRENVYEKVEIINENISEKLKELSISGDMLFQISKGKFPEKIENIMEEEIRLSGIPENLLNMGIPISVNDEEVERFLKKQSSEEYIGVAELIKKNSKKLKDVKEKLDYLSNLILLEDFYIGIRSFLGKNNPEISEIFEMREANNLFLEKAQRISFLLSPEKRCSILTGANSGGKTTLLEHIIQLEVFFQLGLSVDGNFRTPIFTEIYYFAKNKGSMSKGAFETLLTQMAGIKTGKRTLILADEMEAVTEPGVAGNIVNATAKFFLLQGCFLVIATHLGQEIQKNISINARIDGIEAKGLDENFELIVDHNPVLGKLASSTPELIVERLAGIKKDDYFMYLFEYLKGRKYL